MKIDKLEIGETTVIFYDDYIIEKDKDNILKDFENIIANAIF